MSFMESTSLCHGCDFSRSANALYAYGRSKQSSTDLVSHCFRKAVESDAEGINSRVASKWTPPSPIVITSISSRRMSSSIISQANHGTCMVEAHLINQYISADCSLSYHQLCAKELALPYLWVEQSVSKVHFSI